MIRRKPVLATAVALVALGVSGCSPDPVSVTPVPGPTTSAAPTAAPSPAVEPTGAKPTAQGRAPNDLAKSPLKRTFSSGGLTFNVEYATPAPVDTWTANGPKTVRVSLTALNNRSSGQKLYLTRASVRSTVLGQNEDLPGPDPIVDTANLSPGYLVTFPYSYDQSFAIPALDDAATAVQLEFKYEVVSLVDKKSKDYTKQTANDTVRIPLSF